MKNLENVQGDERDVVLFSVGYAPDEKGTLSYNFGPLNRDGGWRRLNVAVTRARCEMVVFSTLEPDQIDMTRTVSKGVAGLKAFLEYAKKGANNAVVFNSGQTVRGDGFAESVCRQLNGLGYQTRRNIGRSAFRVDIGIVHPDDPQRYLLGILLDGEHYRSGENVHDREIGRIAVLQGLGWTIHRLWSIDWWDNADHEVKMILDAIQNALKTEESSKSKPDDATGPSDADVVPDSSGSTSVTQPDEVADTAAPVESESENPDESSFVEPIVFPLEVLSLKSFAAEELKEIEDGDDNNDNEDTVMQARDFLDDVDESDLGASDAQDLLTSGVAEPKVNESDEVSVPSDSDAASSAEFSTHVEEYTVCELEPVPCKRDHFHSTIHNQTLSIQINSVLSVEAPIAEEQLFKRIIAAWGFGQLGAKLQTRLKKLVKKVGYKTTKEKGTLFLWRADQDPNCYGCIRVPGQDGYRRNLTDISIQEIAAAASNIMLRQIGMEMDALVQEIQK
ncbi:MAG: DUF3320 domain-containing protein, partial [Planctomycetia bacterium]|nr:DUF3320 domain-containing protein [Planctomycetia bacterium]